MKEQELVQNQNDEVAPDDDQEIHQLLDVIDVKVEEAQAKDLKKSQNTKQVETDIDSENGVEGRVNL